jgi:hypothetical protein
MLSTTCSSKKLFELVVFRVAVCLCSLWFAVSSFGQQIVHQGQTLADPETAMPDS